MVDRCLMPRTSRQQAERKLLCSQGLGFAIIAAACIVKVPQILKISQNQSAQGLSLLSFELEQLALTIHGTYGFILGLPFSAYGEAVVLVLQNSFLLAQIYVLSKSSVWRPFLAVGLFGTALACISAGTLKDPLRKRLGSFPRLENAALFGGHRRLLSCRNSDASNDKSSVRPEQHHRSGGTFASDLSELQGG